MMMIIIMTIDDDDDDRKNMRIENTIDLITELINFNRLSMKNYCVIVKIFPNMKTIFFFVL